MERARWLRLTPLAVLVLASGAVAPPPPLLAGDPPWDPPPCPVAAGGDERAAPDPQASAGWAEGTWFRLDAVLDGTGTLAGQRLVLGAAAAPAREIHLAPESFATGPVRGTILVGDDDGTLSRLRLVDPGLGCARELGREAAVIRSGILSADGTGAWEHRVDRAGREDLGIWWRPIPARGEAPEARRILAPLPADAEHGRTFVTDLRLAGDGRLVVASCGERACRVRVLDPATGRVARVGGTGLPVGLAGNVLVGRAACEGLPCIIEAIDLGTGERRPLTETSGGASLLGPEGGLLVHETDDGLEAVDVATGTRRRVEAAPGLGILEDSSTTRSGASGPPGGAVLAPAGRPAGPRSLRVIDPATPFAATPEVQP